LQLIKQQLKKGANTMSEQTGQILIYRTPTGTTEIEVTLDGETVWLTQSQIAELFRTTKQNISLHINNIFKEGELTSNSVVKENLTTARDGKKYHTLFYNLDMIISIGYRVNSVQGTHFRIWATTQLKEFMVKGFVLDDAKLKGEKTSYFEELHERFFSSVKINPTLSLL